MSLLIVTLVLWAVVALKEDGGGNDKHSGEE